MNKPVFFVPPAKLLVLYDFRTAAAKDAYREELIPHEGGRPCSPDSRKAPKIYAKHRKKRQCHLASFILSIS